MEEVIKTDGRYPPEAYAFLHEGLMHAVKKVHGEGSQTPRHVTGRQLCEALRDHAVERWGLMARAVLGRWNIKGTIDFGNMVFLLVDNGFMRKTEDDTIEDFRDVFDFDELNGTDQFEMKE